MIEVGFKILARTPVPKLPQSYPIEIKIGCCARQWLDNVDMKLYA